MRLRLTGSEATDARGHLSLAFGNEGDDSGAVVVDVFLRPYTATLGFAGGSLSRAVTLVGLPRKNAERILEEFNIAMRWLPSEADRGLALAHYRVLGVGLYETDEGERA